MLAAANRADPFGRLGSPQEIAETITSLGVVGLSAVGQVCQANWSGCSALVKPWRAGRWCW
ncbi:hypothetical protein ABZ904_47375 [Streptomyces sp. NPDC046900]|uniref:hypothetical protein n=1 Tax=Streptomyces sp. NPDC046900 TaxID=3155473 RepID=UPI0033CB4D91